MGPSLTTNSIIRWMMANKLLKIKHTTWQTKGTSHTQFLYRGDKIFKDTLLQKFSEDFNWDLFEVLKYDFPKLFKIHVDIISYIIFLSRDNLVYL